MSDTAKNLYFYVAPDRSIQENPNIMPLAVLEKFHDNNGLYFRFSYAPQENKFYIQDGSFRSLLRQGDEPAWSMLNQALEAIAKQHGGRMPARAYGDPPDSSIWRKTSDYSQAWREIVGATMEETGLEAPDLPVHEYVPGPGQEDETVSIDSKDGKPFIRLNRFAHQSKALIVAGEDVDYELLSILVKACYISNLPNIVPYEHPMPSHMFAIRQDNKTRIFKAKNGNDGFPFGDRNVRDALGTYDGPVITFCVDKKAKRLTVKNGLLSTIYGDEALSQMLEDIVGKTCKTCNIPAQLLTITCDPCLDSGYVSKLSRHAAVYLLAQTESDMEVMEAPIHVPSVAIVINSPKDEEVKTNSCPAYRAARGIAVSYPFMLVDSRETMGRRARAMLDACLSGDADCEDTKPIIFALAMESKVIRTAAKADMELLISLGMSKHDILDFFSPKRDPLRRHEFRKLLDEASQSLTSGKTITASIGKGLNINDWFHGSQEAELGRARQGKEELTQRKPFNMKRRKAPSAAPRNYEQLLMTRHDKDLSSYKGLEQLLRESQI